MYTPNSKQGCLLNCCIVHCVLHIVAYEDRKALWFALLPWLIYECRCLIVGTYNAINEKFVTSMVRCGMGMQQCAMHNATIQKTTFFKLGVCGG